MIEVNRSLVMDECLTPRKAGQAPKNIKNFSRYFCFTLPASLRALAIIHSSCPLVLRNSSDAHFSTAFNNSGSSRNTKGFFWAITDRRFLSSLHSGHERTHRVSACLTSTVDRSEWLF